MSDNRFNDDYERDYQSIEKPDIMDRFGESISSVFSRRSRKNDKADDLLSEFSYSDKGDEYELFVDEQAQQKSIKKQLKKVRKNVKKEKIRKPASPLARRIRNIVTSCAIVAVVLIVCVVLSLTVLFKTQNYEVSGNTKYDEAQIIKTCGIGGSDNIFLANKKAASKRLVKEYPYIEAAQVSFAIPDTITINITEAVPAYAVKESDSLYYIASSSGRILEQVESVEKYKVPLFIGSNLKSSTVGGYIEFEDEKTLDIIYDIVTVFVDNGYTGITEIDATDTSNITFTYDGRIKVKLGLPEDISYKVRTAMTIITEKLDLNGSTSTSGELDVSNSNTTKKSYFRDQSVIEQSDKNKNNGSFSDWLNEAEQEDNEDGEYDEYSDEQTEETQPPLSPEDWYLD